LRTPPTFQTGEVAGKGLTSPAVVMLCADEETVVVNPARQETRAVVARNGKDRLVEILH
jgi:hypothetical protein